MNTLSKIMKRHAKRAFLKTHQIGLRLGIIVLPKHYYVPIADMNELRRTRSTWARRSSLCGIEVDLDAQAALLPTTIQPFQAEYLDNKPFETATSGAFGPGFGYIEAQALYGFIRGTKPGRIIEVGSGVSTYCMMDALRQNAAEGHAGTITCIEPYPSKWLRSSLIRLIEKKVEEVPPEFFDELQAGDFLFIDSSHTVRIGGDVVHIVLEILPRLKRGVHVHFHDIFLPYDYQRDVEHSLYQWMETALIHAFLIHNSRMKLLFCLSHLHYDRPDALRAVFPGYSPEPGSDGLQPERKGNRHFPSSLYLKVGASGASGDGSGSA